jgi:uncharacterized membrane protein
MNTHNHHHERGHIHEPASLGESLSDSVVGVMGSWRFIIIQSIVVAVWIMANVAAFAFRWDPYPFILLNLAFSTQAAYASPLILMAANRQSSKDHVRDTVEAQEVDQLHTMMAAVHAITLGQADLMKDIHDIGRTVGAHLTTPEPKV